MNRPIDIEDAVRTVLASNSITAYCRPLPKDYALPNILVSAVGGSQDTDWRGSDVLDSFTVNLTSRGETEASALEALRTAIGVLQTAQGATFARMQVNSLYSWGMDGSRPDLALCSATLIVSARPETIN